MNSILGVPIALFPVIIPLFFVGYGLYLFSRAERMIVKFGLQPSTSSVVFLRIISGLAIAMGLAVLVLFFVNVVL